MRKTEKGSALLTLLMISMVLSIIGGVTTSAILSTTKGNVISKNNDDLFYAVESGLEYGQAQLYKDDNINNSIPLVGNKTVPIEISRLVSNVVKKVEVSYERIESNKIMIKSIAKAVDGKIKKASSNHISTNISDSSVLLYENSLAASKVDIVLSGAAKNEHGLYKTGVIDFRSTKIAHGGNSNIEVWDGSNPPFKKLDSTQLLYPEFNDSNNRYKIPKDFIGMTHKPEIKVKVVFGGDIGIYDTQVDKALMDEAMINNALKRDEINLNHMKSDGTFPTGVMPAQTMKIYYANTDNLIIEVPTTNANIEFRNTIIICSGKITVVDEYSKIDLYKAKTSFSKFETRLVKSTLFANEIEVYAGNFHCTYPTLVDSDNREGLIWNDTEDLRKLNDKIRLTIPSWNDNTTSSGSNGGWQNVVGETIYEQ